MTKKILLITLSLFCAQQLCNAQNTRTEVRQKADNSKCSNIVALSGNVNIKCSAITPEQKKLLARIPQLLNKILANQLDPDAIMAKLNEIEAAQKSPQTVYAPNGIGNIGGTLINPQVNNFGYMQKDLSPEQITDISNAMKPFTSSRDRGDLIICLMGDSNSCALARSLVKAFRAAGWNLPGSGYNQAMMTNPPDNLQVMIKGNSSLLPGTSVTSGEGFPPGAYDLAIALRNMGIQVGISIDNSLPADDFKIVVGTKP